MSEQDNASQVGNIELALVQALLAHRTVTIGKVLAYRESGPNQSPVVDVQVAPKLVARPVDGDVSQTADMRPYRNIPVAYWQAGEFTMSTPLRTGQHVLLIVCDRELHTWMAGDGETYRPGIPGQTGDLNDMVAFPFMTPERFQAPVRPSTRQLFIGDRTGKICTITLDSGTGQIDIQATTAINVTAPAVTLGLAGIAAPIARVGVDFVLVPSGGTGGTFPIIPGPIPGGPPSAHKVVG